LRYALDTKPALLVQLAKIGDHALAGPTLRSIGLHQRPIGMPFSILLAVTPSQIHNAMLPIQNRFARGLVFTTRDFSRIVKQVGNDGHGNKALRPSKRLIRN
jgi:hypothetical protein